MLDSLIYDLLLILAAGLFAAVACRWLRISAIIGYLLAGVLIGGSLLGWVRDEQHGVERFAEAGVFLLLFSIGIEFSLDEMLRLGRHLLIAGAAQMILVAVPIAMLLIGLGRDLQPALLVAAAVSFSSTVLVFKALAEWGQTSLPHGRRAVGILLFQDAALVPLLLLVPLLTGVGEGASLMDYVRLSLISVLFLVSVLVLRAMLSRWVVPLFASYRSPELVVLFTLVSLGSVTSVAHAVGLPAAIGAFAAGLIFNGNRWSKQIDALILPFRETFAAVFFVSLGLLLDSRPLLQEPLTILAALAGLILLKGAAATIALRLTGLSWQTAGGMGVGLAHVGEFAFVLLLLGVNTGVVATADYQRIVAIAIGSLVVTPLLLKLGLRWTQSDGTHETLAPHPALQEVYGGRALVVGAGPIGRQVTSQLELSGYEVNLIDLSPINLHPFAQQGFHTFAGDATDSATLKLAGAAETAIAVISVPQDDAAIGVVRAVRAMNADCFILVRCRYQASSVALHKSGANVIVSEEAQASDALVRVLHAHTRSGLPKATGEA